MLRPKKKISKKEIKQDTLVTWYAEATSFYEKQKRAIGIIATAIIVVVIAGLVYAKNRADNNERAMAEIGQVRELFDQGQYQAAIDGVPERSIPGLKSIVDNYGNSKGGDLARFLLASAYYNLGKYDEALTQFEAFSPSDELLTASRYGGIAQCYEGKKNYSEAAGYFEKAGGKYPKNVTAAENLNNAARNYALAGNKEKSLELYKRLKKDYPTSQYARDAERFIAELSL